MRRTRPGGIGFACPGCGEAIRLADGASSRRARCASCGTLVEVPYFPRSRRPAASSTGTAFGWAWVLIAAGSAVILGVWITSQVRENLHKGDRRAFESLVARAKADEARHEWPSALDEFAAARSLGERTGVAKPAELESLIALRDALAALVDRERIEALVAKARNALASARGLLREIDPDAPKALALAEEAYRDTAGVDDPRAEALASEAVEIVEGLAGRRGVSVPTPVGTFLDGPTGAEALGGRLIPILAEGLRRRGFLPPSEVPGLREIWAERAPFVLVAEVDESRGRGYLQEADANRISRLRATFELRGSAAGPGARPSLWSARLAAESGPPPGGTNAYLSTYLSQGSSRDPDAERTLYEFAVARFLGLVPARLGLLPEWKAVAAGR